MAGPFSDHWYVACLSRELHRKPVRRMLLGVPVALYRMTDGVPAALLDRCAHRNAPLSGGRVVLSDLECPYHGWRFSRSGDLAAIPALPTLPKETGRHVPAFSTLERQGFVWIGPRPDVKPAGLPFSFPYVEHSDYVRLTFSFHMPGPAEAVLENALDATHTSVLHRGLFRGGSRREIEAILRRKESDVEVEYVGEAAPRGLLGRLLAPKGGEIRHTDRFLLPSVGQIDYRLGESHLLISFFVTPASEDASHLFASVTLRTPFHRAIGRALILPLVPFGLWVLRQDRKILRAQQENIARFGGPMFASSEADLLSPHIRDLLSGAGQGGTSPGEFRMKLMV